MAAPLGLWVPRGHHRAASAPQAGGGRSREGAPAGCREEAAELQARVLTQPPEPELLHRCPGTGNARSLLQPKRGLR